MLAINMNDKDNLLFLNGAFVTLRRNFTQRRKDAKALLNQ